ncbi:Vacuolar protein-sorting-associated protein 24 [Savitreella phatthalungensis]
MESIKAIFWKPSPQEQVRTWQRTLRGEMRQMDRQINGLSSSELKTKREIKALAKKGDVKSCRMLARELVRARKHVNRMHASKATLNSLSLQLNEQLATIKITGALQKSTLMMKEVNTLVRLPELTRVMGQLQMEMTKAGIMDEMMSDVLDISEFDEEGEEEADEEVERVLGEITGEKFSSVGPTPSGLPASKAAAQQELEDGEEEDEDANLEAMRSRLQALRE